MRSPKSLKASRRTSRTSAPMWKQVNASFGQFSLDTLCASTGALASDTAGRHHVHRHRERARSPRRTARRARRPDPRWPSGTPSSANQKIDEKKAKAWIKQGQGYLDQAAALVRAVLVRVRERQAARQDQAHRRHLRGEPQLRQPVRRLGGRQRPRRTPTPRTRRRSTRPATRTPASSRTTSTSTRRPASRRPARTRRRERRVARSRAPSRTRRSRSTTYIPPTGEDVPVSARVRAGERHA